MEGLLFVVLLSLSSGYFIYQIARRLQAIRTGKPEKRSDHRGQRLRFLVQQVLLQRNLKGYPWSATFHTLIMWGFILLFLSSLDMAWLGIFHSPLSVLGTGTIFLFLRDTFLLLTALGVFGFLFRRLFYKPEWLHNSPTAYLILCLILVIVVSELIYFSLEAQTHLHPILESAWLTQILSRTFPVSEAILPYLSKFFWWLHFLLIFSFFFIIPRSKHLHLLLAPFNIYWHSRETKGALTPVTLDLGREQECGVRTVEDLSWKQMLDAFSCVKCGYCHGQCPAEQSKEFLKPKRINGRIRSYLEEKFDNPLFLKKSRQGLTNNSSPKLVGEMFAPDFLASCTTCGGCNYACPVSIDHLSKIIDMRRTIVSEKALLTPEAKKVFAGVEQFGNPMAIQRPSQGWESDPDLPTLATKPQAEFLFFPGCQGSLNPAAQKSTQAFIKTLHAAGVNFAVPGNEEWCCGETVRRMGNERLFQITAQKNIATLKRFGVKKIITSCPHCFNTFKNEYPQFGASYEVLSHVTFLNNLKLQGRLKTAPPAETTTVTRQSKRIAYHDPCYHSHHNALWTDARTLLAALPDTELIELPRTKDKSFCCGAGGGRFWENAGQNNPITANRVKEILESGANQIATACPYCHDVLDNELKRSGTSRSVEVIDIAELHSSAPANIAGI